MGAALSMHSSSSAVARRQLTRTSIGGLKQLEDEKDSRNETIQTTYDKLYPLWSMLGVTEEEMDDFVNRNMGSTMEVVNAVRVALGDGLRPGPHPRDKKDD